jgi:hypothetical protein
MALLTLSLASKVHAAEDRHRFRRADAEALRAWAVLVKQDDILRQNARRHRFMPQRDLTALQIDLDGDRQPELVLYADLLPYCGSAGCVSYILTRRNGNWVSACETHVEGDAGFIVDTIRTAGWRNLRGTWRITWRQDLTRPAGIACVEGETVPRSEQDRPMGRPRV